MIFYISKLQVQFPYATRKMELEFTNSLQCGQMFEMQDIY